MGKRFYVHKWLLDDAILIDAVAKTWTFLRTNLEGQVYNLNEQPKKISKQRINGLIKRLNNPRFDYFENGFVVDQYLYNYIMDDQQRSQCRRSVSLDKDIITSGDDLKEVLTATCEYLLNKSNLSHEVDRHYYEKKLANF